MIHGSLNDIHTSGHGGQEEQKLMLRLMKPKYFMPIHGEHRMLVEHTKLAEQTGVPRENSFVMDIGDVLAIGKKDVSVAGKIPAGSVYVDGSGIGDIGNIVLRDRRILSEEGLVIVVVSINMKEHKIASGPTLSQEDLSTCVNLKISLKKHKAWLQNILKKLWKKNDTMVRNQE